MILHCITGKDFVQIVPHLGVLSMKNHQIRFKMIAVLTFDGL